jgi:hypothetical protein
MDRTATAFSDDRQPAPPETRFPEQIDELVDARPLVAAAATAFAEDRQPAPPETRFPEQIDELVDARPLAAAAALAASAGGAIAFGTPDLMDFLRNKDVGVTSTGHGLHIAQSLLEHLAAIIEAKHLISPTLLTLAEIKAGASTIGGATVAGVALAYVGPILGLAGTFMALGSGYQEAREEIKNEAVASGFSQGFVAGILNMSPTTTSFLFGKHGVGTRNVMDQGSDVMKVNAHNRGLVAGYTFANTATPDEKRAFVFELRRFATGVSPGDWTDRDKVDYVVAYAAKLRLHYLNNLT